jgi:hypothetical protein
MVYAALQQGCEVQQRDDLLEMIALLWSGVAPGAIKQIVSYIQVWEERCFLEYIADAAAVDGQAISAILPDGALEVHQAIGSALEASETAQHSGLA